jgi:hypothetical protein
VDTRPAMVTKPQNMVHIYCDRPILFLWTFFVPSNVYVFRNNHPQNNRFWSTPCTTTTRCRVDSIHGSLVTISFVGTDLIPSRNLGTTTIYTVHLHIQWRRCRSTIIKVLFLLLRLGIIQAKDTTKGDKN